MFSVVKDLESVTRWHPLVILNFKGVKKATFQTSDLFSFISHPDDNENCAETTKKWKKPVQ